MLIPFILGALALTAVALALVLPALLNRRALNRDHSAQQNIQLARRRIEQLGDDDPDARAEVERALLDDLQDAADERAPKTPAKGWTAFIVLSIPATAIALYLALGAPEALNPAAVSSPPPIAEMVRQLERKLADNPGNADHWAMAARTYMTLRQYVRAERAYQRLHQLVGDDPGVLAAWADATILANAGTFTPQAEARIARALQLAPAHRNALWLAALAAEARADYPAAHDYLQRLLPLLQSNEQERIEAERFIREVSKKVDTGRLR